MKTVRGRESRRAELVKLRHALDSAAITFPFVRGQEYPFRELKEFEAMLSKRRTGHETLSDALGNLLVGKASER